MSDEHFQVQLCRLYPQIYTVVRRLVHEFDNAIKNTEQLKSKGSITISAVFCRLGYGDTTQQFDRSISLPIMNTIFSLLVSYNAWDSISEWFLVYDYYSNNDKRVRVSYENKTQTITQTNRQTVSDVDCAYSQDNSMWKLREYLTRVKLSIEDESVEADELLEFKCVKISSRKYFVVRSTNIPRASFQFELAQCWVGDSIAIAEQKMRSTPPMCSFSCKVLNAPAATTMTNTEKSTIFASLLLKMQDFLDIPLYTKLLQQNDRIASSLPTFEVVTN